MDLIWLLLRSLESEMEPPELKNYDQKVVASHAALLIEQGLAEGAIARHGFNEIMRADLDRLTWAGHDFLDASRDDTIWTKAKDKFMKPGAAFTFDLLKQWLQLEIKKHIGL